MGLFGGTAEWEVCFREIIDSLSIAAGELYRLDPLEDLERPQNFESLRDDSKKLFLKVESKYKNLMEQPRPTKLFPVTKFNGYRSCYQGMRGLLGVYFNVIPWIQDEDSPHFAEARMMADALKAHISIWFTFVQDIPALRASRLLEANEFAKIQDNLTFQSLNLERETWSHVSSWKVSGS